MDILDPHEGIALITDGSSDCRTGAGGWAWIAVDAFDGLETGSGPQGDTTNNQMELTAPAEGLTTLFTKYGSCQVLIYSDSEYVVLGATDRNRKRRKNRPHWDRLDAAIERHTSVEFIHIRGHNDHLYNEMADQLANKARREGAQ